MSGPIDGVDLSRHHCLTMCMVHTDFMVPVDTGQTDVKGRYNRVHHLDGFTKNRHMWTTCYIVIVLLSPQFKSNDSKTRKFLSETFN